MNPIKNIARTHRGVATILMLSVVGLTTLAAVLGAMSQIRATQEQGMALHASTQSQSKAWTGVEIVRLYLQELLDSGKWDDLSSATANTRRSSLAIQIAGLNGLSASIAAHDPNAPGGLGDELVTVNISSQTSTGSAAASSSTVQAVFLVTRSTTGSGSGTPSNAVLVFNDNLVVDSNIELVNNTGEAMEINIAGNFVANSNVKGFDIINSEGNVTLTSNPSNINRINANGDVYIDGNLNESGGSTAVYSRGNICLSSNAYLNDVAKANGSLNDSAGGDFTDVITIGSSDWSGSQLCGSPSNAVRIGARANTVLSNGNVRLNSAQVGYVETSGSIDGSSASSGCSAGSNGGNGGVTGNSGACNPTISPVPEVVVDTDYFNAFDQESNANYALKRVSGSTKVTVNDVQGIGDGEYFLRSGRLCTANNNTSCVSGFYLCGNSNTSDCFSYSSGTFTVKDAKDSTSTMARQGIIWVEGNLNLDGEGLYYNSFVATGNIVADGNHTFYAPNYIGISGNGLSHDSDKTGLSGSVKGTCKSAVDNTFYPSNICEDIGSGNFNFDASFGGGIANFALLSGSSSDPSNPGAYVGGDITIKGNINIYGSLIAGNRLLADSNIEIHGFVTAESNRSSGTHSLTSNVTIYKENISTYTPANSIQQPTTTGSNSIAVLWSRYL